MIKRLKDNAYIPEDLGNRDYIEYIELSKNETKDVSDLYEKTKHINEYELELV